MGVTTQSKIFQQIIDKASIKFKYKSNNILWLMDRLKKADQSIEDSFDKLQSMQKEEDGKYITQEQEKLFDKILSVPKMIRDYVTKITKQLNHNTFIDYVNQEMHSEEIGIQEYNDSIKKRYQKFYENYNFIQSIQKEIAYVKNLSIYQPETTKKIGELKLQNLAESLLKECGEQIIPRLKEPNKHYGPNDAYMIKDYFFVDAIKKLEKLSLPLDKLDPALRSRLHGTRCFQKRCLKNTASVKTTRTQRVNFVPGTKFPPEVGQQR